MSPNERPADEKVNVLLVDDQPANLLALEAVLNDLKQNLVHARSGEEALQKLLDDDFAVILLDVRMPGLSGFETATLIRGREQSRHTPILFLSASDRTELSLVDAYRLGAVDYIVKPVVPDILRAKVAVFVELYKKTAEVRRQADQLRQLERKEFERKLEEERLKASMNQLGLLESVVEHTLDGVILIDEKGAIRSFNVQAERTFGYASAEVVGKNVNILMPEPYHGEHDGYLGNYLRTGVAKIIGTGRDVEGRRKDGSTFPLELVVNEFYIDRRRHFIGSVRDISARRKMELQLLQSQKMEAIGQLAGGVAHDFNNLLTVINGYSELLMNRLDRKDPMRALMAEIHNAGDRAGALTRQLLAFTRQQVLEPKVLDLNGEVTDADKMLRRLIGEDIVLTTKLDPALGPVKVDPGQIQQVLMNLAVNARDAMPQGGMLTIETRNIRLDEAYSRTHPYAQPGTYTMLALSDTGVGMDEATKSRIFEPFFTTKGPGKGTGLGLAMVYGVVKQSGGSIEVYSEPGKGATFKIYLPQVRERVSAGKSWHGPDCIPHGGETLLLVEDEGALRALAAHVLRACGYTVLEATNGKEAVQLLEGSGKPVDLLVSDVVMPYLGGRQLAERAATLRPGIKALFLSGYTDDAVVRHGVLAENFAFLQKPFTTAGLAQKVRAVLDT